MKKLTFKANENITKETIKVGDSYIAYNKQIYDERIYRVTVTEVNGANVELECKWFAYSGGYDFGFAQNFRLENDDHKWNFSGKLYKGNVTKKGEYINTVYKLIKLDDFGEKYMGNKNYFANI